MELACAHKCIQLSSRKVLPVFSSCDAQSPLCFLLVMHGRWEGSVCGFNESFENLVLFILIQR